ncbi:DUF2796 domain-containing protein [Roseateles sp.]|uniref:DUF2796 domain-containing protein n=1 Tax=Roseateles sp. TaxID=1971397 RepID=UPI003BA5B672
MSTPLRTAIHVLGMALIALSLGLGGRAQAHVHGQAEMTVAIDGAIVMVQLDSPLDALLGFEHAPRTPRQIDATRAMAKRLRQADTWLQLTPAAGCTLSRVDLRSDALAPDLLQDAPATPPSQAATPKTQAQAHADLHGEFEFQCQTPAALKGLELRVFSFFPGMRRVDLQVASGRRQVAAKLTAQQSRASW